MFLDDMLQPKPRIHLQVLGGLAGARELEEGVNRSTANTIDPILQQIAAEVFHFSRNHIGGIHRGGCCNIDEIGTFTTSSGKGLQCTMTNRQG